MKLPHVAWQDDRGGLRVVIVEKGPIVEVAAGVDAMGAPIWRSVSTEDPELAVVRRAEGWKEICSALGLEPSQWRQAFDASRRAVDPLPVDYDPWGKPFGYELALKAWIRRNTLSARAFDLVRNAAAPRRARRRSAA